MTVDPDAFRTLVEHLIPMNRHLGLKLERFDLEGPRVVTRLEMRPEFIGNPVRRMPHGGLISFLIDATAGAATALSLDDMTLMDKVATIDMRVDYLTTTLGSVLYTTAQVMRSGSRVIVVRSDVQDEQGTLVALGSNVFNVSR